MTAEQWLADLEDTAKMVMDRDSFAVAVPPATVLRLVAMVRWLADNLQRRTCPDQTPSCEVGCQQCVIAAAYTATEERHDQD